MKSITNLDSSVYYQGQYWNDIPRIAEYISETLTGDKNKGWIENFKEKYAERPFNHALFLNCGDGRWEREFVDRKIVKKVTAFDISPDLIEKARDLKGNRNIKYIVADANKVKFKKDSFNLVVNMAALHHVQYLNRLCLIIARSLKKGGIFISYDFVGPARNQYPLINYLLMKLVNLTLPKKIRKSPIGYPHLPTMLATDPTEAIHSNLITKTIYQYFDVFEKRDIGGGIAYELFTHNLNFSKGVNKSLHVNSSIDKVLSVDYFLTKLVIIPNFFSFILAKPNKNILKNLGKVKNLQRRENIREKYSQMLYNTYTLKDYVIMLIHSGSWRKRATMIIKYLTIHLGS